MGPFRNLSAVPQPTQTLTHSCAHVSVCAGARRPSHRAGAGGLPPGVQLPGYGNNARAMRGRGQRPPPPPRPPKVSWWRRLVPKNKVSAVAVQAGRFDV